MPAPPHGASLTDRLRRSAGALTPTRRAARDGLVQLGEADAVPYLREAALRVEDPEEIASLRE